MSRSADTESAPACYFGGRVADVGNEPIGGHMAMILEYANDGSFADIT